MIEQAAPRSYLDDDKFMGAWTEMSPVIRSEVLRAEKEIRRGQAIQKDRIMGRGKYDLRGFYGLEIAEEEAYRIEQTPRKLDDLDEARKRVSELQAALADEAEAVEYIVAMEAALEPFRQHAAAQGLTLAQYLRTVVDIEQTLLRARASLQVDPASFSAEFMDGLCKLADWLKFDPIQFLMDVNSGRQVTH